MWWDWFVARNLGLEQEQELWLIGYEKNPQGPFQIVTKTRRLPGLPSSGPLACVPGQGVLFPRMSTSSQPVKSEEVCKGWGLLTAWIGISCSVYCPAFFPESCCQAWPQPLEELNDAQCVNGITQHPFPGSALGQAEVRVMTQRWTRMS